MTNTGFDPREKTGSSSDRIRIQPSKKTDSGTDEKTVFDL